MACGALWLLYWAADGTEDDCVCAFCCREGFVGEGVVVCVY